MLLEFPDIQEIKKYLKNVIHDLMPKPMENNE